MIFTDTITLFSSFKVEYSVKYSSTVLKNVSLQISLDNNLTNDGANPSNNVKLYIMNDNKLPKSYLTPSLWRINELKDRYFTLKQGDFIVKGEVNIKNIDYQNIRNTLDDVYEIKSISYISDKILPHWELILK